MTSFLLASPMPIVLLWGLDGVMIYNDGYAEICGARHPAVFGANVREAWPEAVAFNDNVVKVGLAGGTLTYKNQEFTLYRNGQPEQVWLDLDYSPVIGESGSPAGVMAIVTETTAQITASRLLAKSEERLQLALSGGLGIGTWDWDIPSDRVTADARFARLYGVDPEKAAVGAPIAEFFTAMHPEDTDGVRDSINAALAAGDSFYAEYRLIKPDGRVKWVAAQGHCILSEDGKPLRLPGVSFDITQRKTAETRSLTLLELDDRFRRLDSPGDLAFAAAETLGRALNVSRAGYGTIDPVAETITIERDWNAPGITSLAGVLHFRDYGSYIEDLKRGETVVFADAELDPRTRDNAAALKAISAQSVINMPVTEQGGFVALLYLNHATARDWSQADLDLVREVANRTRMAVERRRAEEDLRALNLELERKVIERTQARGITWQLSPDLLGALNADGYFETSNPAWQTLLGWSEDEVAARPVWDLVHPDDVERTRAGFDLTRQGTAAIKFPSRYRCKNGDYRWISWVGVPEDGMVYCSGRDITDEKAAEAERDHLWTLSEDMLARADYSGGLSAVNPAWTKVLGWSEHELLTNPYADIIHPDDLAATIPVLEEMGRTRRPTRFENRILSRDREWKPIGWTVSPEPDGVNFIAVGRDLTDDKARERQLLDAQEALRQSQKMEAVGQLTGGIAHDFNNLLAGISGSLDLIERRIAEGRTVGLERYIQGAQTSARRAASLTQRLLAFARRQTLDPRPTDANKLIAGMAELIRRTVGPAVPVDIVGAAGLWPTKIDASQLENALLNLSINARDAMPEGGLITIETANKWLDERAARERELTPGQYISICVTDNGTGMTPEVITRAFDPFFTTKPIGQGTGLGLSMVHGFVRQSGGQVRIYSEVGAGTTICLYLPRFIGEMDEIETPEILPPVDAGRGETVMVIDDEVTIRMLIVEVLSEAGYRVVEAGDGPSGLRILASDIRIDLLITDVGLPGGINGRQVADAARTTRPDLKVLFITGYAENAVVGNGHLDPGMSVITKPFEINALANRVRDLIEG